MTGNQRKSCAIWNRNRLIIKTFGLDPELDSGQMDGVAGYSVSYCS